MKKIIFIIFLFTGRVSSYHPGEDGQSTSRLSGPACLGLPKSWYDWTPKYPVNVIAMRAGCRRGKIRLGDSVTVTMPDGFKYQAWILDTGPWNAISPDGKLHNCSPASPYKGKLPKGKGWIWKSLCDLAGYPKGYHGGGPGKIRVKHYRASIEEKREMILKAVKP